MPRTGRDRLRLTLAATTELDEAITELRALGPSPATREIWER